MTREHIAILAQGDRATLERKLVEHDDALDAVELQSKYLLAGITVGNLPGYAHMKIDDDISILQALSDLPTMGASQSDINTRLNLLRASYLEHVINVGSPTVDGEHWAADTTSETFLANIPPATDLTTAIALIGDSTSGFGQAIFDHGSDTGFHFHTDTSIGGNGFNYTGTSPCVSPDDCAVAANDILHSLITHYSNGVS